MKKLLSHLLVLGTLAMLLASCGTSAPRYNYKELARASIRLNMDIDMKDNHQLSAFSSSVFLQFLFFMCSSFSEAASSPRSFRCRRTFPGGGR